MKFSRRRIARLVPCALLVAVLLPQAFAREPVTPQRPSVSTDTATTAFRSFELETGYAADDQENSEWGTTLKFGVSDSAELYVGWLPYLDVDGAGEGPGDLNVGTRIRVFEQSGSRPAGAYAIAASLPTGDDDEGLGSGEVDFLSSWIASWACGSRSVTANYLFNVLGGSLGEEHGLALGLGSPIAGDLSGFVELSVTVQPQQDVENPLLALGLGYSLDPAFVLDAAAFVGLGAEAADLSATLGLTAGLGSF